MNIKGLINKCKEIKYWKERAKLWQEFKINNEKLECGLVKENKKYGYKPFFWEYNCTHNWCYKEDFFKKYGCMYIKGFMDY